MQEERKIYGRTYSDSEGSDDEDNDLSVVFRILFESVKVKSFLFSKLMKMVSYRELVM